MAATKTAEDRKFTDNAHASISEKYIYPLVGWSVRVREDSEVAQILDTELSIDYEVIDRSQHEIRLQERFRRYYEKSAKWATDFTLRYEREENEEETERKSEFFKMKAKMKRFSQPFYFVYGFCTPDTYEWKKYVIVDLRALFKRYADGEIVANANITRCKVNSGVFQAAVNKNVDVNKATGETYSSSSLICFEVESVSRLFPEVILFQEGFYDEKKNIDGIRRFAFKYGFRVINAEELTPEQIDNLWILLTGKQRSVKVVLGYLSGTINELSATEYEKDIISKYMKTETFNTVNKHLVKL